MHRSLISFFVLVALAAGIVLGQTAGSGTINGTLTDATGSVVPEATIVVHNTDTGTDRNITSSSAGIYSATFLTPGHYEVTVSKPGFAKVERQNLTLQVGQTLTVDLQMPVQATQETVTVTSETPVVDTEKTENSQVVSQTAVENLPIAGRRWDSFVLLTPNVTTDGGTGLIAYRGISGLYNENSVDGANNNQAFFSEAKGRTTVPYVYSMDSIQEFQVSSSNYSAELGQAAGGVVNAVTKSGTNSVHGDLFYYLRYPTLNALDPLQKSRGIYTQPIHQQQQFGGSVGGPIVKDKLFYFFTYDGSRKINPIAYTSSSTFPLSCGTIISAAACATANAYVVSQLGAYGRFQNQDVGFGKVDYQINSKNRLSTSFNMDNFHAPNSYRTATTQNNESVSVNGTATTHERIFVANWNSTITPSMVNNLRFQWSRDLEVIAANSTGPNVSITNVMQYGMPNALPRPAFPDEHRLQFADTLSFTRGAHTFKGGVDVNLVHELLINLFQGGGVYTYSGSTAFTNWVADVNGINLNDGLTGRHFATFVQVTDPVTGVGKDDFYNNDVAAFFEDSWKVKKNLTLNLGVRYDVQLIPQPPQPNTATRLTTLYTSTINIDKNNFAPRFGMAWQMGKGTVLRAGYGMFYAKTTNSTYYATRVENGVYQQTFNCQPTTCPALTFPNVIFTPPGGAPVAPFAGALVPRVTPFTPPALTQTTRGQSPDWVNPLVHEGELVIEHQLPGNVAVSGGYIFSRGLRLPMFIDTNIAPATTTKSYDITNSAGATQSTFTSPLYTTRLDPTGPVLTGFSDVNSWYNSFVLTVRKSMSHGLEFTANYTLAKAIDGGQVPGQFGTFNGTDSPIDPYNRKLEYALSDLDQRHRFVGNLVWVPQYAQKLTNKPAKLILDGWTFSMIVTKSAGQPVTPTMNLSSVGGVAGGLSGGVVNNSGTALNTGRVPFVDRNSVAGPGFGNLDIRVGRQFKLGERVKLAFLGEAFNLFNWSNVYAVNTTQYNSVAANTGVCAGHTSICLVPNAAFYAPTATNNNLSGARQLQISGRFSF